MRGRRTRAIYLASFVSILAALSGCQSPSDGAPIEADAVANPVPDVNPQGLFRSIGNQTED